MTVDVPAPGRPDARYRRPLPIEPLTDGQLRLIREGLMDGVEPSARDCLRLLATIDALRARLEAK